MHCLVKVQSIIGHKIQLVKQKNCNLIILDLSGEGDENYTEQAIGNMINEYQNKFKTKTIALSQNFLSCNNENIFYYNFAWEHFNKEFRPRRSYQEYKYKYNYLGGYPRKDKLLFFNTLVERKDFKESISSMGTIPKELLQYASPKALSLTPAIIDHDMLYSKHSGEFWKKINEKIYNQSRFSLVQETEMQNNTNRYTEKTLKAIAMESPFIIVGNFRVLKGLRKEGFYTYKPYINEEYDNIEDPTLRIKAIHKEIDRLSKMSDREWFDLENIFLKRVANHNRHHLKEFKKKDNFISSLQF